MNVDVDDDFDSIEDLSKAFLHQMISTQKKLREVRRKQFHSMSVSSYDIITKKPKNTIVPLDEHESEDFIHREKSQIAILAQKLNKRLASKIKIVEDNSFKMRQLVQERILLRSLEKKRSKRIIDALKSLSEEYDAPLTPLLVHVDMLLQKQDLTLKQKNHLRNVQENILSCLDVA